MAVSAVIVDGIARSHVLVKLGASAETSLNAWSATGAKPTDASVLPAAAEGFVQGFAVAMIALAIAAAVVGTLVLILGNRADKLKKSSPITFASVDFPEPDGPRTATNSPYAMSRLTSLRANISSSPSA